MEDLVKAAEALITHIEEKDVFDTIDNDGDKYIYHSQSHELKELVRSLKHAIEDSVPTRDAMKLIKKCFITKQ